MYHLSITMKTRLVTTLKRKATEIIAELQSDRDPVLITEHGKPAAYLVDVEAYDELTRRVSILEGIALGEQAIRAGKTVSQSQARKRLSKWLK
jgi:prevent-host-death family protein